MINLDLALLLYSVIKLPLFVYILSILSVPLIYTSIPGQYIFDKYHLYNRKNVLRILLENLIKLLMSSYGKALKERHQYF